MSAHLHLPTKDCPTEGTPEEILASIEKSNLPAEDKTYLAAKLAGLQGRAFRLTYAASTDHPGEFTGTFRFVKIF